MSDENVKFDFFLKESFYCDLLDPYLEHFENVRTRKENRRHILAICAYFCKYRAERFSFEQLDLEDAKHYFLSYLVSLCEKGEISYDTFGAKLSSCRGFGFYLNDRIQFFRDNHFGAYAPYESPFTMIVRPAFFRPVHTEYVISDAEMDKLLFTAKNSDDRAYLILLLSLRMMLQLKDILSLDVSMFNFVADNGRTIGILSFGVGKKERYMRVPADIVKFVFEYCLKHKEGPLFVNAHGNRMTNTNVNVLLTKLRSECGSRASVRDFRCKGLLDLAAQGTEHMDEICDYTGLSKQMVEGYGKALDNIASSCIADQSTYHIIERGNDRCTTDINGETPTLI